MFLTKECDYGVRIIRALADGDKMAAEAICEAEYIPLQYSYKIIKKLEKRGILQSYRGRGGGYRLKMLLSEFTLYDVLMAVDDKLALTDCLREGFQCVRNTEKKPCSIRNEFMYVQQAVMQALKKRSMSDVILDVKRSESKALD